MFFPRTRVQHQVAGNEQELWETCINLTLVNSKMPICMCGIGLVNNGVSFWGVKLSIDIDIDMSYYGDWQNYSMDLDNKNIYAL